MEELLRHRVADDRYGDLTVTVAHSAHGRLLRLRERRAPEGGSSSATDEVALDAWSDRVGWLEVVAMNGHSGRSFADMSAAARRLAAALK